MSLGLFSFAGWAGELARSRFTSATHSGHGQPEHCLGWIAALAPGCRSRASPHGHPARMVHGTAFAAAENNPAAVPDRNSPPAASDQIPAAATPSHKSAMRNLRTCASGKIRQNRRIDSYWIDSRRIDSCRLRNDTSRRGPRRKPGSARELQLRGWRERRARGWWNDASR